MLPRETQGENAREREWKEKGKVKEGGKKNVKKRTETEQNENEGGGGGGSARKKLSRLLTVRAPCQNTTSAKGATSRGWRRQN